MNRKKNTVLFLLFCAVNYCISQPAYNRLPALSGNTIRYGLVIGNENYQIYADKYTSDVVHAIYDAEKFAHLIEKNSLVQSDFLSLYLDATNTNIKLILNKIQKTTKGSSGKVELVFYFNGKTEYGFDGELYLFPVDAGKDDFFFAMPVTDLYKRMETAGIGEAWIFLDAANGEDHKPVSLLDSRGKSIEVTGYPGTQIHLITAVEEGDTPEEIKPGPENTYADVTPAEITVYPFKNENVKGEGLYKLEGKVKDESGVAIVAVNGEESHLSADGTYFANIKLDPGANSILVEAIDFRANYSSAELSINYVPKESRPSEESATEFYALLIAVNEYNDPMISDLSGPVSDLRVFAEILSDQYMFKSDNIVILENPSSVKIWEALSALNLKINPEDNLIFVFSGHGSWDEQTSTGYWLASDASSMDTKNWITNKQVTALLSEVNTKHTLVIADACFGGGIFRTRSLPSGADLDIIKKFELRSRNAMTSGDLNEVPDKSAFMYFLVSTMKKNKEKFITAEQLFYKIKIPVMDATDNIPQFGKIKSSGDEGGDFVFVKNNK